jgi:hypothetical protein
MRFGANMPMLSRQGFIDLGKREYLKGPEAGYEYLGTVVQRYGVWRELGAMPKSVLPNVGGVEDVKNKKKTEMREMGGKDEDEKPPLPPRSNSENGVKIHGGDEKVGALLKQDEWKEPTTQNLPESLMKAKGGERKVEALSTGETWDEMATDSNSESPIGITEVESNSGMAPANEDIAAGVKEDGEKMLEPSAEELDAISAQEPRRK